MAIEKKLICFARLEEFERQLAAGNILDYSIVFIQDAKKIWTRGTYYDCNNVTPDWNAGNGEEGYINNRTHYGNFIQYDIPTSINSDTETAISINLSSAVNNIYVNYRYEQYNINETICLSHTDKEVHTLANGPVFRVRRDGSSIYILGAYDANQQLFVATQLTKLSDIYIPNTIARLTDIPKGAYITDFSLGNLADLHTNQGAMQCNLLRLQNELLSNNIVLVPYENSDSLGYELLTGSVDDFLYFGVHSYVWGETYYVEIQRDRQEITSQDIQVKKDIYKEEVSANYAEKSSFGDISDVVIANGLDNGNMLYALPDAATGDEDDIIATKNTLKTINGESIIGSGDIVIEGGETLTESDIAAMGFTKNTGTYSKPSGGIPKTDLASAVQTSLGKADTALQAVPSGYATETYVNNAIASAITTTLNTAV